MFYCSSFFPHEISELGRPIGARFCTVVCTGLNFKNWVQTFGGPSAKKFRSQKQAKFCAISSNYGGEYLR